LNDLDRLRMESTTTCGWIACTTDAILMEKTSYYDLLIDLTTSTPDKSTRPTFYSSKPVSMQSGSSRETHRLSTIRFAWSDVRLWNELDRILQLDSHNCGYNCCASQSPDMPVKPTNSIAAWTDAWRVYEDVCLICAGLWIGSWRGNSSSGPENWGSIRLEGDDDMGINARGYVRNVGMGIEGGPNAGNASTSCVVKNSRGSRGLSWSSAKPTLNEPTTSSGESNVQQPVASPSMEFETIDPEVEAKERRDMQLRTTSALLQTFHAHTVFQLSMLASSLPLSSNDGPTETTSAPSVVLTPKDILAFELCPLSETDARYLDWLAEEYAGGVKVVVKRSWKELIALLLGCG